MLASLHLDDRLGGHLHVTPGADIVLESHDGRAVLGLEEPLVGIENFLIDALGSGFSNGFKFGNPLAEVLFLAAE